MNTDRLRLTRCVAPSLMALLCGAILTPLGCSGQDQEDSSPWSLRDPQQPAPDPKPDPDPAPDPDPDPDPAPDPDPDPDPDPLPTLPGGGNIDDPNQRTDCGLASCPGGAPRPPLPAPSPDEPLECRERIRVLALDDRAPRLVEDHTQRFDEQWRPTTRVDARGAVVESRSYDDRGRLASIKRVDEEGQVSASIYSYDGAGRLSTLQELEGDQVVGVTVWGYDARGRVQTRQFKSPMDPELDRAELYRYDGYVREEYRDEDLNGRLDPTLDRLIEVRRYDERGRLSSINPRQRAFGGPDRVTRFTYDERGVLLLITDQRAPDADEYTREALTYDARGLLTRWEYLPGALFDGVVPITDQVTIRRDARGRPTRLSFFGTRAPGAPLATLELSGAMCERSVRDWRMMASRLATLGCGAPPCVAR